jgi:hypothetical protein
VDLTPTVRSPGTPNKGRTTHVYDPHGWVRQHCLGRSWRYVGEPWTGPLWGAGPINIC